MYIALKTTSEFPFTLHCLFPQVVVTVRNLELMLMGPLFLPVVSGPPQEDLLGRRQYKQHRFTFRGTWSTQQSFIAACYF